MWKLTRIASALAAPVLFSVLSLGATSASANPNLLVNPSFEINTYNGTHGSQTLSNGVSTVIAGWTIAGVTASNKIVLQKDSGAPTFTGWQAAGGDFSLELANGAGVYQNVATTVGQTYLLSFDLAGNPAASPPVVDSIISSAAATQYNYAFFTAGSTTTNMNWTQKKPFTFTAVDPISRISFTGSQIPGLTSGLAAIDLISLSLVSPAPEPNTWAMMLVGIGVLGAGLRLAGAKSRKAVAAA